VVLRQSPDEQMTFSAASTYGNNHSDITATVTIAHRFGLLQTVSHWTRVGQCHGLFWRPVHRAIPDLSVCHLTSLRTVNNKLLRILQQNPTRTNTAELYRYTCIILFQYSYYIIIRFQYSCTNMCIIISVTSCILCIFWRK